MSLFLQPSAIVLRVAVDDDVPAITQIEHLSFVHAGERFGDRRIATLISSSRAIVTVAEIQRSVRGWVAGLVWLRGIEPWGRVYALAVHPETRRQRLGPQLLQHMIDCFRQRGCRRIFLEVRPDNHAAIRLYEKFGFTPCRTLPHYYGPERPAHRMVRPA